MLSSKKRKSPTNIKESLNDNADRFYKMFRIHTTAKVAMSLIAMTAVGFSFYNLYEQWQDAEGKKDHIAVIRISGEMGTGSETGDGTVIATALAKAYNNPHAKAVIIEAESGGGGPSDAIIIYRQINALKNHQPQIERVSDAGGSLSSVAADESIKTGSTERGDEARSKQNSLEVLSSGTGRFFSDIADSYKPIIVSVKGICASACYYAVSPADAIYADSNALIGSIGVRMDHWNLSEIMSTVGVKNEPLTAGEFKDALDPFHPLSDSTREFMQKEILNTMHEKFITDVELGRGKKLLSRHDADAVSLYSGRVWPTPQAVKYGLVDGDLTSVEIRTRLSKMYSTDTFKNYNEPHRNLRSALGMLMSLSSNIESLTSTTTRLVESVNATSYPSVR
ncbi:S49 family peptidase [Shigella flexneri]